MNRDGTSVDAVELRARAEARLKGRSTRAAAGPQADQTSRLIHELEVHQIELELQNEELRAARTELESGLRRQTDLYDFAPMGYLTLDGWGGIRRANLAGARMLGMERAGLIGARLGLFVSPECLPTFNALLEEVFESQTKQVCEVALRPKTGVPLWVHLEAVISNDGGGECRVVLIDRTERRRLEETLRFRLALLDYAAEHSLPELLQETLDMVGVLTDSPIGFYHFVEPDQNTLSLQAWSRRTVGEFCKAKGQGSHYPIEQAGVWVDCVHQRRPVIHNDYASLSNRKGLPEGHAAITRELVVPVMRLNVIVAIIGVGNKPTDYDERDVQIVSHLADVAWTIVERKRAEPALQHSEEQLRVAHRMESIGRLAGGVAHDFNNLLTVISNHADFALEDLAEGDPLRTGLFEIRKAADRAAALTRQLLAFSRKQVMQPQVLDLNKIVGGMEAMLRRLLGETVELSVGLALGLGKVMADPGQIEQVVMNLAVNARDAMPNGGKLTIETADFEMDQACANQHAGLKPGPHVMLSVTDTGCGMDEETRARLFEPFFTTKEVGRGTGLGLATVYGIVKQSGGSIGVRSQPGQGSTFNVYLPRELSEETNAPAPRKASAGGSETILVVEDEEAVRNLAKRILSEAGYTVLTAAEGSEALLICEQCQGAVHLMLTDVIMPRMNGGELADRLVKLYPKLRVVFMSGYTDNDIVHHGVLDPGTHFIGKPFHPAELRRIVRQVLDGEATSQESRSLGRESS